MYKVKKKNQPIPRRLILFSIPITALIGALILMLPACNNMSLSFLDTLFTAVSALCVNGLLTIPLSSFTELGQLLILFMMQIGGLGIITITLMVISSFARTGISTQVVASQILEIERFKDIKKLLVTIISFTLIIECIGAILLFLSIKDLFPTKQAIFYSAFHSISAFCNAGLSIFPAEMAHLNHNLIFMSIMAVLILIGSLGFITWHEILYFKRNKKNKLSLNSKLVLSIVGILVAVFAALFLILEYNNAMDGYSWWETVYTSIFNAIAIRGSGLMSVDINTLQPATLLLLIISSFIGASPGSTGGGIKTSAFIIFLATARAAITNHDTVEIKKRRIPKQQVLRALTIITLSIIWITITTFCLLITEQNKSFFDLLFEANSAFSMFGVSLGVTPDLSFSGKVLIMVSMIFGRIGSLTLVLAFVRTSRNRQELSYPEERLMLS
jgi:trk system potassium uptake protein TrkH